MRRSTCFDIDGIEPCDTGTCISYAPVVYIYISGTLDEVSISELWYDLMFGHYFIAMGIVTTLYVCPM